MSESVSRSDVKEQALLLTGDGSASQSVCIARVLGFFGISCKSASVGEFLAQSGKGQRSQFRLLCSSDVFLELSARLGNNPEHLRFWRAQVHSAFVYAGDNSATLQAAAEALVPGGKTALREIGAGAEEFVVSGELQDFCRGMAGLRVMASPKGPGVRLCLGCPRTETSTIIWCGQGANFLKLEYQNVAVFLSTAREIIDLDREVAAGTFDVREHFLTAVPIVLYLKWAFPAACWSPAETNACLIIDDPLLKPSYGFVNFDRFSALMAGHRFSTNVAFIPWNWRRSSPRMIRLFSRHPDQFSISVHGCDHTRAEFGSPDEALLYWKANEALDRMAGHESLTGLQHDPVMVFPQGVFSEAAMSVLAHAGFIAAVNNDVISSDSVARTIRIADVWDVAVMSYSGFPIFTRRYPWEGIENFAFDATLGKQCLAVIHHDFCQDDCRRLVDFIERLNALRHPLSWRGLGEVARRACRQRELNPGHVQVEMYSTELRIENSSDHTKHFSISRRQLDPELIRNIQVESRQIAWSFHGSEARFELELEPAKHATVRVQFHELRLDQPSRENLRSRFNTGLRRYFCEARDNYCLKYGGAIASRLFQVN